MSNNKNSTMMFWKKSFPLCSFSISKCLPAIAGQSPPPHLLSTNTSEEEDEEEENDNLYYQTTNTSSSYSSSFTTATNNPNSLYATNDSSPEDDEPEPDFSSFFASERFFFSSPGKSNSIVDQHTTTVTEKELQKRHAAVEVRKYSADPRLDFRRSMKEMIEARHENDRHIDDDDDDDDYDYDDRSDLEYLHELLLCFLALNPKDTHKYVISAFTDIVVDLLSSTRTESHARRRREVKLRRKRSGLRRMSM